MLPCICPVIDHRGRQNVVRTSVTHSAIASCATFLFLPHFDVICDLLLDRCTATWNLFVKYICYFPAGRSVWWKTVTEGLKILPEAAGRVQHFSSPRSQFFTIRTDFKLANNMFIFFPAVNWLYRLQMGLFTQLLALGSLRSYHSYAKDCTSIKKWIYILPTNLAILSSFLFRWSLSKLSRNWIWDTAINLK